MQANEFKTFLESLGDVLSAELVDDQGLLTLSIPLDAGRRQRVYLGLATDPAGNHLLVMYTHVGVRQDIDAGAALELNATIPYGALAVLDDRVVMRRTETLASLEVGGFAERIELFALNADVIEESLYGRRDRF